jgi:predicted nucleic acid-binding protein
MGMIGPLLGRRIYVDANVFIYALESFPKYAAISSEMLAASESALMTGVTSESTLSEMLMPPFSQGRVAEGAIYKQTIRSRASLTVAPVSRSILIKSAEIRATAGGGLPDAIHVASAIEADCECCVTADSRPKKPPTLATAVLDDLMRSSS